MESITIISDDVSGIEDLIKMTNFITTPTPGLSGKGVEVIRKLRKTFGGGITVKQVMGILKENPQLVTELNDIGQFEVTNA